MMLGLARRQGLRRRVGDKFKVEERTFRIVGIFSTSNVIGDTAGMFPLSDLQAWHTEPGVYTLAFVRVRPHTSIVGRAYTDRDGQPAARDRSQRERLRTRRPQPRADHGRERRRVDPRAVHRRDRA